MGDHYSFTMKTAENTRGQGMSFFESAGSARMAAENTRCLYVPKPEKRYLEHDLFLLDPGVVYYRIVKTYLQRGGEIATFDGRDIHITYGERKGEVIENIPIEKMFQEMMNNPQNVSRSEMRRRGVIA